VIHIPRAVSRIGVSTTQVSVESKTDICTVGQEAYLRECHRQRAISFRCRASRKSCFQQQERLRECGHTAMDLVPKQRNDQFQQLDQRWPLGMQKQRRDSMVLQSRRHPRGPRRALHRNREQRIPPNRHEHRQRSHQGSFRQQQSSPRPL